MGFRDDKKKIKCYKYGHKSYENKFNESMCGITMNDQLYMLATTLSDCMKKVAKAKILIQ